VSWSPVADLFIEPTEGVAGVVECLQDSTGVVAALLPDGDLYPLALSVVVIDFHGEGGLPATAT